MDSEINSGFTVRNYGAVCTKQEVLYNSKGLFRYAFSTISWGFGNEFFWNLSCFKGICTSTQMNLTSMRAKLIALMPEELGSTPLLKNR